jgi:hypothetical protein
MARTGRALPADPARAQPAAPLQHRPDNDNRRFEIGRDPLEPGEEFFGSACGLLICVGRIQRTDRNCAWRLIQINSALRWGHLY